MEWQEQAGESLTGCCETDSLFERHGWFYALCREHLFHDHTHRIAKALWCNEPPPQRTRLLEVGCGPGFYSCSLAARYPQIQAIGIDLSQKLLSRARNRAARRHLGNCVFQRGDVYAMPADVQDVDAVIVSRLFLIVPNREQVLREVFRVLRPGGQCFIADPVASAITELPLQVMWLLAKLTSFSRVPYVEPAKVQTLSRGEFQSLLRSQPWAEVQEMYEGRYQFAVCRKPLAAPVAAEQMMTESVNA